MVNASAVVRATLVLCALNFALALDTLTDNEEPLKTSKTLENGYYLDNINEVASGLG